ncbi:MAG: 50S ribosomal protein L20 [Planctomycetota bacterium]|nr:MAG: 50S ribosomal protein L20 [Planctomycetota bacterium]
MRVTNGVARRRRRKRILKRVKGFYGRRKNLLRTAIQSAQRAEQFAFIGRKRRKRDLRRLWITRISAAARALGMRYATLIHGLKQAGIQLDRKQLAALAVDDPPAFQAAVEQARGALEQAASA